MEIMNTKERLSSSKKNANDKAYYKEQANILDGLHYDVDRGYSGVSEFKKMKVNYDLFNNILVILNMSVNLMEVKWENYQLVW